MKMQTEVKKLKDFFNSSNVPVSERWLEPCVEWCKEEVLSPNYSFDELKQAVHEQWLSLDLRDIEVALLPPNLGNEKFKVLNSKFSLQLMQIVDISRPKHWQLQQIRKENTLTRPSYQENESIGTGKRVLLLTLTDGVQVVEATEYMPIKCLNINLPPGVKVRLRGPLTVRRGRILLEEGNIKILGGEVEELMVPNAPENVLARHLKLPLNPKPVTVDCNIFVNEEDKADAGNNFLVNPKFPTNPKAITVNNSSIPTNFQDKPKVPSKETNKTNNFFDDDDKYAEEIELLMEAEKVLEATKQSKPRTSKTPDLFDDDFETEALAKIEEMETLPVNPLPSQSYADLVNDDFFSSFDSQASKDITVTELNKLVDKKDFGVYTLKARFKTVYRKLDLTDEYRLSVTLEDNTGEINVKVDSSVVTNWAGVSCFDILALRNKVMEDRDARSKIENALQNIKNKLVQLDGRIEIEYILNEDLPILKKVL